MADTIFIVSLAYIKALLVSSLGDGYSDRREVLGLIRLWQATSELPEEPSLEKGKERNA